MEGNIIEILLIAIMSCLAYVDLLSGLDLDWLSCSLLIENTMSTISATQYLLRLQRVLNSTIYSSHYTYWRYFHKCIWLRWQQLLRAVRQRAQLSSLPYSTIIINSTKNGHIYICLLLVWSTGIIKGNNIWNNNWI